MDSKPLVTIVIPTRNSAITLEKCLLSVQNQTYKNIEVILVDNYSKDDTPKIANKHGAKYISTNAERAESKNIGLRNSCGKFVCFIDSDMELSSNVIKECVEIAMQNPSFGGIIIPEKSVGNSFWVRVRDFERSLFLYSVVASARFFNRDTALDVGGFDESVVFFEESTLPQRLDARNYNTKLYAESLIIHNESNFNFFKWLQKKYYYGKSTRMYSKHYDYSKQQLSVSSRLQTILKNGRWKLLKNLHLTIAMLFLKTCEFLAVSISRFR